MIRKIFAPSIGKIADQNLKCCLLFKRLNPNKELKRKGEKQFEYNLK
jgi:hypothetical protein